MTTPNPNPLTMSLMQLPESLTIDGLPDDFMEEPIDTACDWIFVDTQSRCTIKASIELKRTSNGAHCGKYCSYHIASAHQRWIYMDDRAKIALETIQQKLEGKEVK